MARLLVTPQAEQDLIEIWLFVAAESEEAADALLRRIHKSAMNLLVFPSAGTLRDDLLQGAGIRSSPVGNYLLFYRVVDADVQLLRVLHGARDLDALF